MAYQNIGKCRFYIDYLSYWHSIGYLQKIVPWEDNGNLLGEEEFFIGLDPTRNTSIIANPDAVGVSASAPLDKLTIGMDFEYSNFIPTEVLDSINYVGILGHTLTDNPIDADTGEPLDYSHLETFIGGFQKDSPDAKIGQHDWNQQINTKTLTDTNIINGEKYDTKTRIDHNGFSIWEAKSNELISNDSKGVDRLAIRFKWIDNDGNDISPLKGSWGMNSLFLGHYYDMPVSADLKLKMQVEFDGYDQITTMGGSTLTNTRYTGSPLWRGNNPWEIG